MISRFYFALEIRELARHLSGNKDYSPAGEESCDDISLVMDRVCDRARGQNTAIRCFYFEFPGRKEQSATSMLGSFLNQIVSGMERIPGSITEKCHWWLPPATRSMLFEYNSTVIC